VLQTHSLSLPHNSNLDHGKSYVLDVQPDLDDASAVIHEQQPILERLSEVNIIEI
jgi:hypothetical protein